MVWFVVVGFFVVWFVVVWFVVVWFFVVGFVVVWFVVVWFVVVGFFMVWFVVVWCRLELNGSPLSAKIDSSSRCAETPISVCLSAVQDSESESARPTGTGPRHPKLAADLDVTSPAATPSENEPTSRSSGQRGHPSARVLSTWVVSALLAAASLSVNRRLSGLTATGMHLLGARGFVTLAALFAVSEALVIHVHIGNSAHTFSIIEAVLVIALIHSTPNGTLLSLTLGSLVTLSLYRRQKALKLAFNVASFAFTSQLAFLVFRQFNSTSPVKSLTWLAVFVAILTYAIAGAVLVSCVIAINEGRFDPNALAQSVKMAGVAAVLTSSCGVVAAILITTAPSASPLMIIPIGGAYLSNVVYSRERRRAEELAFLQKASGSLLQKEASSLTLRSLLERAVKDLRIQYIELVYIDQGLRHRIAVPNSIADGARPDDHSGEGILDIAPAQTQLRNRGELGTDQLCDALGARGLQASIVTPVRVSNETIGVLIVGDRSSGVVTFDGDDVRVSETLASQVAIIVENGELERSIGDLRELERRLVSELQHDALTGLLNRTAFARRSKELLGRTQGGLGTVAMVLIDLDDFKQVNDNHGHAAGDALLKVTADRLSVLLRPGDVACRMGGDEFAVLLTRISNRQEAESIAGRISIELCQLVKCQDAQDLQPGASIGLAIAAADDDYTKLAERADTAMYRAKAAGKGSYSIIDPATDEADQQVAELIGDLKRGLERNELSVVFQPVVSFETGSVEGVECLARWAHPSRGDLHPQAFLDIGHEPDVVRRLDRFVIEQAAKATQQLGEPFHRPACISINLSAVQLADDRVVEKLASLTLTHFHPGWCLGVEVNEQNLHRSLHAKKGRLATFREAGFAVIIDDLQLDTVPFALIEEIRPTLVKLARRELPRLNAQHIAPIVGALGRLGKELGFGVVAKGIEDIQQEQSAIAAGCTFGQGYLYSSPVSLTEVSGICRTIEGDWNLYRSISST